MKSMITAAGVALCMACAVSLCADGAEVVDEYWFAPDGASTNAYTKESPGAFPPAAALVKARAEALRKSAPPMRWCFKKGVYPLAKLCAPGESAVTIHVRGWQSWTLTGETGNPADVVFDGEGFDGRAFALEPAEPVVTSPVSFSAMTFRNFRSSGDGGAIAAGATCPGRCLQKVSATNCRFENNEAWGSGGAVWGAVVVRDSTFVGNVARTGTGGAICGKSVHSRPMATAKNCVFRDNAAPEFSQRDADTTIGGNHEFVDSTVESWSRGEPGGTKGPFCNCVTVAPGGDIDAARDRLRRTRERGRRAEIVLEDGCYAITNAIFLGGADSQLTLRAAHPGKVIVTPGRFFDAGDFTRRGDSLLACKVDAASHAYLTNAAKPVLSVDGVALVHARWPNEGAFKVRKEFHPAARLLRLPEDRQAKWTVGPTPVEAFGMVAPYVASENPVKGYRADTNALEFAFDIGDGTDYFFHGILEEIDRPGEWAYDAKAREIVMMAPTNWNRRAKVALGLYERGALRVTGDGVKVQGLVFTAVPGIRQESSVSVSRGTGSALEGCTFTAFGGAISSVAVGLSGTSNRVQSCDFADVYGCCVSVSGGRKSTLTPGGNVVDNCRFTNPCLMRGGNAYGAVHVDGVGNRVSHCLIHGVREHALDCFGFDCVIEYCRTYDANLEFRDSGVFYSGCYPFSYGNTYRFNDVSGSPGLSHGIYPDDMCSGYRIYGNVIRNVGWGAVFLGGGRDNLISNNVISSTFQMALHNDNRGLFWDTWKDYEKVYARYEREYGIETGPVSRRWPAFRKWKTDDKLMFGNVDNVWTHNVVIDSPETQDQVCLDRAIPLERQVSANNLSVALRAEPHTNVWRFGGFKRLDLRQTPDKLFKDVPAAKTYKRADGLELFTYRKGDFSLAEGSVLTNALPGFVPIPWDKIGLYRDEWRTDLDEGTGSAAAEVSDAAAATANGSARAVCEAAFDGKKEAKVIIGDVGAHVCWLQTKGLPNCVVNVAGEDFGLAGANSANGWMRLGTVMLPAGWTAALLKGDAAETAKVLKVVLTTDSDWKPDGWRGDAK